MICGKVGHYAQECYNNKSNDRRNGRPQQGNYASSSNQENDGHLFFMQHMMSAITHDVGTKDVWYVDSGASNYMTYHQNWFKRMEEPSKLGYAEIGDDTMHPIEHVGNVPLSMHDGNSGGSLPKKCLSREFNRRYFLIPYFTHFLHTEGYQLRGVFTD